MVSIVSLGIGFILKGHWPVLFVLLMMVLFWIIMKKRPVFWFPSTLLFAYVFLAAFGVNAKLSMPLIVVGCTTALASWESTCFDQSRDGGPLLKSRVSLEKYHLQSLVAMVGASLLLAAISLSINLHFSFGITVLLALLTMGCLTFGMQYYMRMNK
jgi:hypothetical protein